MPSIVFSTRRAARRLAAAALALAAPAHSSHAQRASSARADARPNIVVFFADDLGYGDLSSFGHPTIRTPHIDALGAAGVRLTTFYAAASVCTPSRAALLTGRYAARMGLSRVLFPQADTGIAPGEITLAEALRARGYRTAAIGKWHIGARARFLPTAQGFDSFLGVPYSNDMDTPQGYPPLPLLRDTTVIEQPIDQSTLTARYTDEAIRVVRESRGRPFFVYLAYTMPHVPLHASAAFRGRSRAGLYGDVVEEMDASVGRVVAALRAAGLERNTIVIFTSDNGPWQSIPKAHVANGMQPWDGGSAGPFRGAKMSSYEGGFRVPAVVRWPARDPRGAHVGRAGDDDGPATRRCSAPPAPPSRPTARSTATTSCRCSRGAARRRRRSCSTCGTTAWRPCAIRAGSCASRTAAALAPRPARRRSRSCTTSTSIPRSATTSRTNTRTSSSGCARGSPRSLGSCPPAARRRRDARRLAHDVARVVAPPRVDEQVARVDAGARGLGPDVDRDALRARAYTVHPPVERGA